MGTSQHSSQTIDPRDLKHAGVAFPPLAEYRQNCLHLLSHPSPSLQPNGQLDPSYVGCTPLVNVMMADELMTRAQHGVCTTDRDHSSLHSSSSLTTSSSSAVYSSPSLTSLHSRKPGVFATPTHPSRATDGDKTPMGLSRGPPPAPTPNIKQESPSPGSLSTPRVYVGSVNMTRPTEGSSEVPQLCVNDGVTRTTSSIATKQVSDNVGDLTRPPIGGGRGNSSRATVHPVPEGGGDNEGAGLSSDEARKKRQEVQKMRKEEWHRKHQMQVTNQQGRSSGGREEEMESEGVRSGGGGGVTLGDSVECHDDLITDGECLEHTCSAIHNMQQSHNVDREICVCRT